MESQNMEGMEEKRVLMSECLRYNGRWIQDFYKVYNDNIVFYRYGGKIYVYGVYEDNKIKKVLQGEEYIRMKTICGATDISDQIMSHIEEKLAEHNILLEEF